jgi:CO dehydrogenase nickel-insertion accessory protein CooC1
MSRLLVRHLQAQGKKVCAIDSDHNMDFTDLLGVSFDSQTPTFKSQHGAILNYLDEQEDAYFGETIKKHVGHYKFFLDPMDEFSARVMIQVDPTHFTMSCVTWS